MFTDDVSSWMEEIYIDAGLSLDNLEPVRSNLSLWRRVYLSFSTLGFISQPEPQVNEGNYVDLLRSVIDFYREQKFDAEELSM